MCGHDGSKSFLYKHVACQIEGNEEQNTVVQNFAPGACLRVTRGQKVEYCVLLFDCHPLLLGFYS